MNPFHWIATFFYLGKIPHLGTSLATIVGIILTIILRDYISEPFVIITMIALFFIGLISSYHYLTTGGGSQEIVIDEIVGVMVVLVLAQLVGYAPETKTYIAAFIAFRIFDGVKLWPIDLIEQGGEGAFLSMIDDVISGVYAFAGMAMMLFFYNALLG